MDDFTQETFAQNLNTKFHISIDEANQVEFELVEVSEVTKQKAHDQFAVVFRGPLNAFVGQGMHSFDHERLGRLELFIVPIRQDAEGFYYEAVFNQFRK